MSEKIRIVGRLSFLKLFEQYGRVEIPLIQRDYAQGRESAKTVREQFLDSLHEALRGKPLNLDFIYGEVKTNKTNTSCFEPIDGQQRLTTLFLLHWYMACVSKKQGDFAERLRDGKAPRFQYSVRKSSNQFFDRLLNFMPDLENPLPKQIEDQAWFFRAWKEDATIRGALVMLEAIQEKFHQSNETTAFYEKLCSDNCPITFDVLNLGNLDLSDEIYIKMNARGKELTRFEKFKAWLIENHWEARHKLSWPKNADVAKQWPILLDGDWLDLFWSFRPPNDPKLSESVSEVFFRTVLALAVNFHASINSLLRQEWMDADCDERRDLWGDIFTETALQSVFKHLWQLSSLKKEGLDNLREVLKRHGIPFSVDSILFSPFFDGKSAEVELKERLWLHALCLFLEHLKKVQSDEWFRAIRNLIENSSFEQSNFANAVQSISELAAMVKCGAESEPVKNRPVLTALTDFKFLDLQVFDGEQKKEESKKAGLILGPNGAEWEKTILEAERHPVFLGQIGFLLDGNPSLADFQKCWNAVKEVLGDGGSKVGKEGYQLARAALSQSDRIQLVWQRNLKFKDTAAGWRELLSSSALEENDRPTPKCLFRKGMLKLVDRLKDYDAKDYQFAMEAVCKETNGTIVDRDWMDDVILYGHVLLKPDYSREQKVQHYYNHGTFLYTLTNSSDRDIMLGEQARVRNVVIQSLLTNCGLSLDDWRKVPEITDAPFYKGHQFYLHQNTQLWRVLVGYHQIVLQRRNTGGSQSATETWNDVLNFELFQSEDIAKEIMQKITSSQTKSEQQP